MEKSRAAAEAVSVSTAGGGSVPRRVSNDATRSKEDATGYTTDMSVPTLTIEEELHTATEPEGERTESDTANRMVHFRSPSRDLTPSQLATPRSMSPASGYSQSSAGIRDILLKASFYFIIFRL